MATGYAGTKVDVKTQFCYIAGWRWQGTVASSDPNAIDFGPRQWPTTQGMIRPMTLPKRAAATDDDRKPVNYLPIKRRDGKDQIPSLTIFIALRPCNAADNFTVPDWVGTTVEVLLVNLFQTHGDNVGDTIKLVGKLDETLTCKIEISADDIEGWLKPDSDLKLIINNNLLDYRFTMYGVRDLSDKPVQGQAQSRVFFYCRKTAVFLPGLFASELQIPRADGGTMGYPDWWDEDRPTMNGTPTPTGKWQHVDVLECDDRGMPLVQCPNPSLLMLGGPLNLVKYLTGMSVIDPFNAMHEARMSLLPRVPEDFRLFKLVVHPYDWRCDLTDAAANLLNRLTELKTGATGLTNQPDTDDQVAIMGHSTGGVVIRRALAKVLPGDCSPELSEDIKTPKTPRLDADKLISLAFFLSVPFSGAPKAASVLSTGLESPTGDPQIPFLEPASLVAVALSMPIVYHLHTSARYKYRPSTSPSSPPRPSRAAVDNELDKAAFVKDMLAAGWMPKPWIVKASVTDPATRKKLAMESQTWHQFIYDYYRVSRGRSFNNVTNPGNVKAWFGDQLASLELTDQKNARHEAGWSDYLAKRAQVFHAKSAAAMTDAWKNKTAIFWGSCKLTPTLRQVNLSKDARTFSSAQAFLDSGPNFIESGEDKFSVGSTFHDPGHQGGTQTIEQWTMNGPQFTSTRWKLEWVGQLDAGDGTVPGDSQLAEHDKVAASFFTTDDSEVPDWSLAGAVRNATLGPRPRDFPEHMGSPKAHYVWHRLAQAMHLGRIGRMHPGESAVDLDNVMTDPPLDALFMLR